jgi:galactose mutarotase-like enzyme
MSTVTLQNNNFTIMIKSFGAELCSVISKKTQIEYIWQANETIWPRHAPNLFPIVGKLKNNSYSFQSKNYLLTQHGFARDFNFTCIEQTQNYVLFELVSSEQTLVSFPFLFKFQVGYQLIDNKVKVTCHVFNTGETDLYFSVGAHPAFNCPLQSNESFNDYQLVFENKSELIINTLNEGLIKSQTKKIDLTRGTLNVTKHLFDEDALVFKNSQIDEVSLVSTKSNHGVKMISKDWPNFGIWTKKNTEHFICLEPWHGIADSIDTNSVFEEKEGVIKLSSAANFTDAFEMFFF